MKAVLHSLQYSLDYLKEQVSDLPAPLLMVQPNGISNHPAWTMGHLVYIFQMLGGVIGLKEWLPPHWEKLYGPGSIPDNDLARYPSKEDILSILNKGSQKISAAVASLTEEELDRPFPDEAFLDVFPTIRHAITQVLVGHTAFHVGQLSIWRKAVGLPSLVRSYE